MRRLLNIKFIENERVLAVLDRVVTNEYALVAGIGLFFTVQYLDWWNWIEPFLSLVVLPVAGATAFEYWRDKNRRYELVGGDSQAVIVAVCVNQPVSAAVQEKYGRAPDLFLSTSTELGRMQMSASDMHAMAKKLVAMCLKHQNREIILVAAVPQAMAFQIGQLLGCHKFRIKVLNFAAGQFDELPIMTIDDMPG